MTESIVLLLHGPNLNLLGQREPEIYGTATLDDHVAPAAHARPRRTGSTLEHVQSNHEGELVDAIHGARGRCAAIIINAGALHPLRLVAPRRAGRLRRPVVELHLSNPQRPRAVAAHVGGRPGGHGLDRGLRRRGYRLGARRRRPSCSAGERTPSTGAACRWTVAARRRPRARGRRLERGRVRRAARHAPGEHPLPHRLHRLGRRCCWCCPTSWCSSPTAATASRPPSSSARAGVDARHRDRHRRWPASSATLLAARAAGLRRLGLEADGVTWAQQRALRRRVVPGAELVPTDGLVERAAPVKDDGEVARIEAAAPIADAAAGARAAAARRAPDRAEFGARARHRDPPAAAPTGTSFETIVAVGPNGAKPHHRPARPRASSAGDSSSSTSAPGRRLLLRHDPHGHASASRRRPQRADARVVGASPARRAWPRCAAGVTAGTSTRRAAA